MHYLIPYKKLFNLCYLMNLRNIFVFFYFFDIILLDIIETANNRVYEMTLNSWREHEQSDVYTCIQVMALGTPDMVLDSIRSDQTKEARMVYDPARLILKEFDSKKYPNIELQIKQCNSQGEALPNTYMQDFFNLYSELIHEFSCDECMSRFGMGYMAGYIKIVSSVLKDKVKGIQIQSLYVIFKSRRTKDGKCCIGDDPVLKFDECRACNYNFAISFGGVQLGATKIFSSEDNREIVFPNIIISGNFQNLKYNDPRLSFTIQQYYKEIIDEFSSMQALILHPYQEFFYSLVGDSKHVEISGTMTFTSEGYAGTFGKYSMEWINNIFTIDNNGQLACVNSIYVNAPNCDKDISGCYDSPCLNEGKCISILGNYQCQCPNNGFYGYHCEKFTCARVCINSQCIGLNKCGPCFEGWAGATCETRVCLSPNPCGGRTCKIVNGRQTCECNDKIETGDQCQFKCRVGCIFGKCAIISANPRCVCYGNYTGIDCNSLHVDNRQIIIPSSKSFIIFISAIPAGIIFILLNIAIIYSKCYKSKGRSNLKNDPIIANEINSRKLMLLTNTNMQEKDIESNKNNYTEEKSTVKSRKRSGSRRSRSTRRSRSRKEGRARKIDSKKEYLKSDYGTEYSRNYAMKSEKYDNYSRSGANKKDKIIKSSTKTRSISRNSDKDNNYDDYYKLNSKSRRRSSGSNGRNYSKKENGDNSEYRSSYSKDYKGGNYSEYYGGEYSDYKGGDYSKYYGSDSREYKGGNYNEYQSGKSNRFLKKNESQKDKNQSIPVNVNIEIYEKDDQIKLKFINDKENNSKNQNEPKMLKDKSFENNDYKTSRTKKSNNNRDNVFQNPYE